MEEQPIYRAGIIGCGRIASTMDEELRKAPGFGLFPYTHAGVYRRHPRTQLVAAADIKADALRSFGERWGVSALYADYREMLANEQLDLVSIATLSRLHHEMTMETAKYPVKGIFLEKPIAQSLLEADEMIEACRRANIKVVINHTRTFDPYFRAGKALIDSGEIGEVRGVLATWKEGFSFGGSHLFDLLRYQLGSHPEWVFCHLDKESSLTDPGGDAYLAYQNGVRAHISMPSGSAIPPAVDILGTAGRIHYGTFEFQWWKMERPAGSLVVSERAYPGRNQGQSGMVTAVEELIRSIETGVETSSTLEDGRNSLEVTVALLMSGRQGEPVRLPVADRGVVAKAMY